MCAHELPHDGSDRGNAHARGVSRDCRGIPALTLHFENGELVATEFFSPGHNRPVRTSLYGGPRMMRIQSRRRQILAWCVFMLLMVAWALAAPERARAEIAQAAADGHGAPESTPAFEGPDGVDTAAATLVEALKSQRNQSLNGILGDRLVVEDMFCKRLRRPAVWLDTRHLSPLDVTVTIDGEVVTDPERLLALAREIEGRGRWELRMVP